MLVFATSCVSIVKWAERTGAIMRILPNCLLFFVVVTLVACSVPVEPAHIDVQTPHHIELSEGEELRQITINLAPGAIKRFRISLDQFVANLQQVVYHPGTGFP